jgi:hypothetical protein
MLESLLLLRTGTGTMNRIEDEEENEDEDEQRFMESGRGEQVPSRGCFTR